MVIITLTIVRSLFVYMPFLDINLEEIYTKENMIHPVSMHFIFKLKC